MSVSVGVAAEGTRLPLTRSRVAEIVRAVLRSERVGNAMISVTFVSDAGIRALNRRHLGRHRLTDVIAFGFRAAGSKSAVVGDVYIAPGVARASARANGVPVAEEMTRLVVHGTLHVLGHDHPESDARMQSPMWRRQERLVHRLARRKR